tara:strand:- start:42 stop:701 length:660 start_codon:yes stop_codon:yes gene_type:complete
MQVENDIRSVIEDRRNSSRTNHTTFDRDGFFIIKNIVDVSPLNEEDIPDYHGLFTYSSGEKQEFFEKGEVETVGNERHSRYLMPKFARAYLKVKQRIQKEIGKQLYNTYWFDRYYFNGSFLSPHCDRDACEISCSLHLRSNLKEPWVFGIEDGDGNDHLIQQDVGDAVVYKGCERIHWRPSFPDSPDESYHHNVFFHYVLKDGLRSHYAYNNGNYGSDQ